VTDERSDGEDEIEIARGVWLKLSECRTAPLRSGGPGGQNVNKVSNGVELRWSVGESAALGPGQKARVRQRLASRINASDELVLRAVEFRERPRNLAAVVERLRSLLSEALHVDPPRRATRPTRGSERRRRAAKSHRSEVKRQRRSGGSDE